MAKPSPLQSRRVRVLISPKRGWFGLLVSVWKSFRRRSTLFSLACLVGLIAGLIYPDLPRLAHLLNQTVSQISQTFNPEPPIVIPKAAVSNLSGLNLWSRVVNQWTQFGHFPYEKAALDQLMALQDESYMAPRFEFLHREAAFSLIKMVAAAQTQGIQIAVVSGYRDFATQASLFQNRVGDLGSEAEAAKSVAPPGYSEHHTGYAVDLTDGAHDFRDFDQTPAFQWMVAHAHEYGFELSFPPNNLQGVDYEPWHWRFVGSPEAAGLFEAVREGQL